MTFCGMLLPWCSDFMGERFLVAYLEIKYADADKDAEQSWGFFSL